MHVECESNSNTNNKRGNRDHLKTTQTIPEQHTRKAQKQRTTVTVTVGTAHILRKVVR